MICCTAKQPPRVAVLGEPALTGLYLKALDLAGVSAEQFEAAGLTLKGLRAAYGLLREERT